jgi:hypothetical protein
LECELAYKVRPLGQSRQRLDDHLRYEAVVNTHRCAALELRLVRGVAREKERLLQAMVGAGMRSGSKGHVGLASHRARARRRARPCRRARQPGRLILTPDPQSQGHTLTRARCASETGRRTSLMSSCRATCEGRGQEARRRMTHGEPGASGSSQQSSAPGHRERREPRVATPGRSSEHLIPAAAIDRPAVGTSRAAEDGHAIAASASE